LSRKTIDVLEYNVAERSAACRRQLLYSGAAFVFRISGATRPCVAGFEEPNMTGACRRAATRCVRVGALVRLFVVAAGLGIGGTAFVGAQSAAVDAYRDPVDRIVREATASPIAWTRLAEMTDMFPARLSGSANLQRAIEWSADQLKRDGFENVRLENVKVPHWVRGSERAEIVAPFQGELAIASLGGSIGTGTQGVQAEALVVKSFDDLEAQGATVRGKIVVYNVVYESEADPLVAYRQGTQYRGSGASRAARLGAVAALVRSVGPTAHRTPHTGGMRYATDAPQIPVAAVSGEDADKLQRMQDRGTRAVIRLAMEARTLADAESANVVAELRGREKPDEIVLIGGHIDSWDLASGAMDDGGGVVATWEALRVLKKLNLIPRRTIRLVFFTNEENGTRGGQAYRDRYASDLLKHVMVLESDNGMLPLKGWGFSGTAKARSLVAQIAGLLQAVGGTEVTDHFDGADVGPAARAGGIPAISPEVDMRRYFVIHHTPADTVDKIDPAEMARCVAAIAGMAYVVADMPEPLDRAAPPGSQRPVR
jgi:carboxypeptidase Q